VDRPGPDRQSDSGSESEIGDQRSLLRHARNYLSASLVRGILALVSVAVLTRLLTPGEYGTVAVYLSVVALFSVLLELNLRSAVGRYHLEETTEFPSFLKSVLVLLAFLGSVNLAVLWWIREPLSALFNIAPLVFYCGVVAAALQVPWNINWKLLVAMQKSGAYARLSVLRESLALAAGVALVISMDGERHWGMIAGNVGVAALLGGWLGAKLIRLARPGTLSRGHLRYALWFGVPLIPHALSGYLMNVFDRVILNQLEGPTSAGYYSFAYDVGAVMNTIVQSFNQAWLPIFTKHRNRDQNAAILELTRTYAAYVLLCAIAIITLAREIVIVLASEQFYAAISLIPIVVFSYVFMFLYQIYSGYAFHRRRSGMISAATLIAGVANVVLNYWLIPIFGMAAAAWTTLFSYALLMGLHYSTARWVLRDEIVPLRTLATPLSLTVVVASGVVWFESAVASNWVLLVLLKVPVLAGCAWIGYRIYRRGSAASVPNRAP
jgi:O-antigen/teichoic acid export membrane protein